MKRTNTLTVVYGGQWGSEGKGDVVAHLVQEHVNMVSRYDGIDTPPYLVAIRVGGPNAGHTILDANGTERKVQSIPCAAFLDRQACIVIGASAVVDLEILERELGWLEEIWHGNQPLIILDEGATIITDEMRANESHLKGAIGSTGEGVGAATCSKVMRNPTTALDVVQDQSPDNHQGSILRAMIEKGEVTLEDTVRLLNMMAFQSGAARFLIEGTQGYQLSLNVSGNYPYTTSRDCGPEALMAQVGLSPRHFQPEDVRLIAVFRTFPIRVGGNSGPLPDELSWDELKEATAGYVAKPEKTTVTKKDRRISRWDWDSFYRTIWETRPTELAITFLDYLDPSCAGVQEPSRLSGQLQEWLLRVNERSNTPISILSCKAHGCFDLQ